MALTRKQIAERLRAAREAIGFTQAEVADSLGMHRPTVSEIEAGRRAVSSEELYRFAELYAASVSELLSEPTATVETATAVLFRKEGAEKATTRAAIRRFIERCRAERELEGMLELPLPTDTRPGYRVPAPRSTWDAVQQGNTIAEQERRRLDIGIEPIRAPLDLLEKQGVRIGPVHPLDGDHLDGCYLETDELGPCVAVNSSRDDWTGFRAAFTAAHEYAHWLLRDVQVELFEFQPGTEDLLEVRANAFAAAFLLPENGVRQYFAGAGLLVGNRIQHLSAGDVVRAMDFFGVSRTALLYRLQNIGLLEAQIAEPLRGFPLRETAKALGIEFGSRQYIGTRLPALAIHAWRKGLITAGRAADLCEIDLTDFKELLRQIGEEPELGEDVPPVGAAAVG